MPVTLHAKSGDAAVRHHREATAQRVIDYFGDRLPPMRLLCFLDDNDSGRLRGERGRYETIHDGTPLAHLPDYVSERIYVDDHVSFYFPRVIDGLVFLYGSTCANEVGLSMTLAHELQHTVQRNNMRQLWAANSLVNQLKNEVFDTLKMTWSDIPIEREARIVSKHAAVQLFDEQRVTEYIEERIREHVSDGDFADWQFIHSIAPMDSVDLLGGTRKLFQQLKDYKPELESALLELRKHHPEDFGDINLDDFIRVPTNHLR
jgi:hypothetical protein